MKRQKQWLLSILGALVALTINSVTWAGVVPLENRLPAWGDYGPKTVDFTNIDITYTNGKRKYGPTAHATFLGRSSASSVISLNSPTDGYVNVVFDGDMVIDANISSKGVLRAGSTFGIYSNDVLLFFGEPVVEYGCNIHGNNCSTGMLIYGGTITAFGWSGSQGILEFSIGNLGGWAHDTWPNSPIEKHIFLDVGAFTLNDVSSVKSFRAVADGFAVVEGP
jgi:hypothetical protein